MIKVSHAGIVVKNIENSLKFYKDILDLKIESMNESPKYIDNIPGFENVHVKMSASIGNTLDEYE